jgi:3-hydroxy-3-methylglutaryl CoA synthase
MTARLLPVGIEKINAYPGSMSLDLGALCAARNRDAGELRDYLMIDERSVIPPWEDTVTLAANAAAPMLTEADRQAIGLLIVGTETSLDQEKPISSWLHGALGLPGHCRNFEIKHACYGATGAIQMAAAWLASGLARGRKALVVSADSSLLGLNEPYEPVMGACACAALLSGTPRLVEYELEPTGVHAHDVSDVIRPTPRLEMGNSETSIYSYMELLVSAYASYESQWPDRPDFDTHFAKHVYHVPFGGICWRAHRTLLAQFSDVSPAQARAHFQRKVEPSLIHNRRIGGSYGASTLIALIGLCDAANDLEAGDRVGVYAYGSGACGEFYGVRIAPAFRAAANEADLRAQLDARQPVAVETYECAERTRDAMTGAQNFTPDLKPYGDLFSSHYVGRQRLVLEAVRDYQRSYTWV